jgi:hypothetical protein
LGVRSANGSKACKTDAKRTRFGGKAGRNHGQRVSAAAGISAAAHHAGVGGGRRCARCVLGGSLGISGRLDPSVRIRGSGFAGRNRMCDAEPSARPFMTRLVMMLHIGPVTVTAMGVGCDRRELNDDQQDRRPNHPQECSGRSHVQSLPYGPSQRNNGSNCGKCMVIALINGRTGQ